MAYEIGNNFEIPNPFLEIVGVRREILDTC